MLDYTGGGFLIVAGCIQNSLSYKRKWDKKYFRMGHLFS
jgi:hypothetical protein